MSVGHSLTACISLLSLLTSLLHPQALSLSLISSEEPFSFLLGITVHNSCPRLPGTKFPFLHPSMLSSGACPPSCLPSFLPALLPWPLCGDLRSTSTKELYCNPSNYLLNCLFPWPWKSLFLPLVFIAVDVTEGFTWRKCSKCWMKKIRCLSPRNCISEKVYTACLNSVVPYPWQMARLPLFRSFLQ